MPIDDVKSEWAYGLGEFKLEDIATALEYTLNNSEFPPNLPKFKLIVKSMKREQPFMKLERKFTPEEVQANRARLAGILQTLQIKKI